MDGINEFLGEFQWGRKNEFDLWGGFIAALKVVLYETELE